MGVVFFNTINGYNLRDGTRTQIMFTDKDNTNFEWIFRMIKDSL